jgi:hypothetical protein
MPLLEERYDQHKIDSLKRYLQRETDKNRARDYEIIVDGFKVVSRTNDIGEFDDYEQEIKDNTRNLSILIYDGDKTNRNTKYSFALNQDSAIPAQPQNSLGSLGDIDQIIQQKMDDKDKDYQINTLKEKLEETEEKLEESEEFAEKLKAELEHIKANRFQMKDVNLLEVGAELLKFTINQKAKKSPFAAQLSGILGAISDMDQPALPPKTESEPDCEVTVQEQPGNPQPALTEIQLLLLDNIQQMERVFTPEQMPIMNRVMNKLMENPSQLIPVAELLNVKIKNEHGQI